MPTLVSPNSGLSGEALANKEAELRAAYPGATKDLGHTKRPALKPTASQAAVDQTLASPQIVPNLVGQAARVTIEGMIDSQLHVASEKHRLKFGTALGFSEAQALEQQLRGRMERALPFATPRTDPEIIAAHREAGLPID